MFRRLSLCWSTTVATPLAVLLAVALLARVAATAYLLDAPGDRTRLPDSSLYQAYAETILEGDEYAVGEDKALRPPGYPAFLAACCFLVGRGAPLDNAPPPAAALVAQAVLGAATVAFAYRLCVDLFGSRNAGLFAATLLAVEPYSVAISAMVLTETVFTFLLTACLATLSRSTSWTALATAGGLFGLAVLTRPSVLPLGAFGAIAALLVSRNRGRALRGVSVALLAFFVVMSPWWIRNALVFERFVPTATNLGESLFDGLNERATGASDLPMDRMAERKNLPELERDAAWLRESLSFAWENPARVASLALVKARRFWSPWPNAEQFRAGAVTTAIGAFSIGLYLLAVTGLALGPRSLGSLLVVLLPILYYAAIHLVFVGSVRYRIPVHPLICVLAGVGADRVWSALRIERRSSSTREEPAER